MPSSKTIHAEIPKRAPIKVSPRMIPRPFVKWAGGKRQLIPVLMQRVPSFSGRYFEPFLGGGALFFFMKPEKAYLSDTNAELIHCYNIVRDDPDALIAELGTLKYTTDDYYRIRDKNPATLSPVNRAARTIYLNRTGFNGLYRVNSKGKFNVPMGRYVNPKICDEKNIRACSAVLRFAEVDTASFDTVVGRAGKGDFVYFDPPYIPLSRTANFTSYQQGGFSMEDQARLAEVFEALTRKGVYAMLSNSDVKWMHDTYKGYPIQRVSATRAVNRNANDRGPVFEVVVTNY